MSKFSFPQYMPLSGLSQHLPYTATFLILLSYGLFYGRLMNASTAVPTFDQAAYMTKTYAIADRIHSRFLDALSPDTWLGAPAANRPPLMMAVPAVVLGPTASPQAIGLTWLTMRLVVLLGALHALARLAGRADWLPAAALVILSARGSLLLYPNMYTMDQSFEAFGLLTFAYLASEILITWRCTPRNPNPICERPRISWRGGAFVAVATLCLFLIKPAALVFVLPLYVILFYRVYRVLRSEGGGRKDIAKSWAPMLPYLILAAVLLLFGFSSYGHAVWAQYALGAKGYWREPYSVRQTLGMAVFILPPWLLLAGGVAVATRRIKDSAFLPHLFLIALAAATAMWWFLFNGFLTYTLDARVLSAAMPVAVVGVILLICRTRWSTMLVTGFAAFLFLSAFANSRALLPASYAQVADMFAPMPPAQEPLPEVGLLSGVLEIKRSIAAANIAGDVRGKNVMIVTSDDFVELAAINVAMRYTGGAAGLSLDSHPWGSDFFLPKLLSFEWFLTKERRNATPLRGDVWTGLHAIDALLTHPDSPLHPYLEPQWSLPIHQPAIDSLSEGALDDTITFWRLREIPSPDVQLQALRYIVPFYAHTAGEGHIKQQIQNLETAKSH